MYIPLKEVAHRANNLGYQIYFADESSTQEIENNVRHYLGSPDWNNAMLMNFCPVYGIPTFDVQQAK